MEIPRSSSSEAQAGPERSHYASLEQFWVRAHRVFVYMSEPASGIDCGAAVQGSTGKACEADRKAATSSKPPSSCSYAAAMSGESGCNADMQAAHATAIQDSSPSMQPTASASGSPSADTASSCPVLTSDSGEALHPLTRMPMSLYTEDPTISTAATAANSPASSPSTTPPSKAPVKRSWWRFSSRTSSTAEPIAPSPTGTSTATTTTASGQPLSTESSSSQGSEALTLAQRRQRSSIPMAKPASEAELPKHQQGVEGQGASGQPVWMYPSEQMFYQAMKRKGWEPEASDMRTVVSIHNTVNERAWQEVCAWEALHCAECPAGPRLARFQGRPSDLSPKARLLNLLGYAPPFDRHDWTVDRCGKQVRYIIDFYAGVPLPGGPPAAMWLDTRPALDSFEAAWDRATLAVRWALRSVWQT